MPRLPKFKIAQPNIEKYFDKLSQKVFYAKDLKELFEENRQSWGLTQSLRAEDFIVELINQSRLQEITLHSPNYNKTLTRYSWDAAPSVYQVALLIKPNSFFSHHTALLLHKLTRDTSKIVYLNTEQSKKPSLSKTLEQNRIDLAFKGKGRTTQYFFNFKKWKIFCISGKNTGNLGVEDLQISKSEKVPVTNIERTLIDISVRPIYAGGVYQVLDSFEEAKGKFSVEKLIAILKQLDFTYPYHQVIGFYMERAGYSNSELDSIRKIKMEYDFYLDYEMKEKDYSKEWKVYFPKDL